MIYLFAILQCFCSCERNRTDTYCDRNKPSRQADTNKAFQYNNSTSVDFIGGPMEGTGCIKEEPKSVMTMPNVVSKELDNQVDGSFVDLSVGTMEKTGYISKGTTRVTPLHASSVKDSENEEAEEDNTTKENLTTRSADEHEPYNSNQTKEPITNLENFPKTLETISKEEPDDTVKRVLDQSSNEMPGTIEGTPHSSAIAGLSNESGAALGMSTKTEPIPIIPSKQPDYETSDSSDATKPTEKSVAYDEKVPERREDNLKFYRNEIASKPFPGSDIEEMLKWHGDYKKLENGHSYIQWLFPIPESSGLNYSAQELFPYEAEEIRNNKETLDRVLRAYKMMLNFYGMDLVDETSGKIRRCEANWVERFEHLNRSFHNYLRITRILKSIGELGYDRYQKPLVKFIIAEAVITKNLSNLNADSMNYWINAIKDHSEMTEMYELWQETCENPENFDEFGNVKSNNSENKLAEQSGMVAGIDAVAKTGEPPKITEVEDSKSDHTSAKEENEIESSDKSYQNTPKYADAIS
ncbi:opioid growth factor receptor-like protein 1 isoform X2 [Dreissena polymorpha]|uniref:opioid growth factor receptor-like protein 1 isoform X2 n=1 Tax=Dreissena polymorpha TaxID=45954 RepID=UPI002264BCBF|nr:opioid growth factor receptor-like protein 1 isoform X2 [Dreissena polymorpha]